VCEQLAQGCTLSVRPNHVTIGHMSNPSTYLVSCNLMSCIFTPRDFGGPSFTRPAFFSVNLISGDIIFSSHRKRSHCRWRPVSLQQIA